MISIPHRGLHLLWNSLGPATLRIDEDPVRFTLRNHYSLLNKFVVPHGFDALHASNPSPHDQFVILEDWTQILDLVGSRHPDRAVLGHHACPAQGLEMQDRDVLHPLDIGHIVDVTIAVDHRGGDRHGLLIDCAVGLFAHWSGILGPFSRRARRFRAGKLAELRLTRRSRDPIYPPPPRPQHDPVMRTKRKFMKTQLTRPRKGGAAKRRRQADHRKRLVALGVEAEVVARMNQKDVRDMLKYPAKVAKDSE